MLSLLRIFIITLSILFIIEFTDFKMSNKCIRIGYNRGYISAYTSVCFLTTRISLTSMIFDNNIFNLFAVLFIKLLILLLLIIVHDGNELFKLSIFIELLKLLLFIHVLHLYKQLCYLNY